MSRTFVPAWDEPIHMTMEEVRDLIRERLVYMQGDADKAGDVEDAAYYQGGVDVCNDFLMSMTFPRTEDDARICQHDRKVWFGNECGDCETSGYVWKDAFPCGGCGKNLYHVTLTDGILTCPTCGHKESV